MSNTSNPDTASVLPEGKLLYEMEIPVRWGDMDALGHVNNIMYFRYFETTRLNWFESLGFPPLASSKEGLVIVDNHAEYLEPVVYPATMLIRMGGHSPGRSSFVSTYTISVHDGNQNEKLMTRGSARIVWIDSSAMKSTPLPEKLKALLAE